MSLLKKLKEKIKRVRLSMKLGVRVGEETLADMCNRRLEQRKDPLILPGLIVEDSQGKKYVTGQEEYGGQDEAGILLYDAEKPSWDTKIEPLLVDSDLRLFRIVGFSEDERIWRLIAQNTSYTAVNYSSLYRYKGLASIDLLS